MSLWQGEMNSVLFLVAIFKVAQQKGIVTQLCVIKIMFIVLVSILLLVIAVKKLPEKGLV